MHNFLFVLLSTCRPSSSQTDPIKYSYQLFYAGLDLDICMCIKAMHQS